VLTARNFFVLGLITLGLISCAQQSSAQPPLVEPTPIVQPAVTQPPQEVSTATSYPQEIIMFPTITPEPSLQIPPVSIYYGTPPQWAIGESDAQVMAKMIDVTKSQNQVERAQSYLPNDYINAVVNLDYETEKPWGGTATFIGFNTQTNESIFITDSHVMLSDSTPFHIKQPQTGLDIRLNLQDVVIARAPEGQMRDIAVVKLPFIPQGVTAYTINGNDLCVRTQPVANSELKGLSFPYLNKSAGGKGFTPYFASGLIETVGDQNTIPTTCWHEQASGQLGIPTTVSTRFGSSGTLLLDTQNNAVGLIRVVSPHGAVITPVNAEILNTLDAQTGFTMP